MVKTIEQLRAEEVDHECWTKHNNEQTALRAEISQAIAKNLLAIFCRQGFHPRSFVRWIVEPPIYDQDMDNRVLWYALNLDSDRTRHNLISLSTLKAICTGFSVSAESFIGRQPFKFTKVADLKPAKQISEYDCWNAAGLRIKQLLTGKQTELARAMLGTSKGIPVEEGIRKAFSAWMKGRGGCPDDDMWDLTELVLAVDHLATTLDNVLEL